MVQLQMSQSFYKMRDAKFRMKRLRMQAFILVTAHQSIYGLLTNNTVHSV